MIRRTPLRAALFLVMNVLGALAFLWPFVLPALARNGERADGPWILIVLVGALAALLFIELGRGGMGPKTIALLGVLGAAVVALRLPGFIAGFSALFIPVLVGGNAFGPGFGFLLGAVGMFASGLFIGGLGPWLPFQMVAVGWVGAGAGLLPKGSWRVRIGALAAYGFATGYLYGGVMNLWSWPFVASGSALGWDPDGTVLANLRRYRIYYATTSLVWDTFRAIGNAALILVLARPLLGSLDRAARRMRVDLGEQGTLGAVPVETRAAGLTGAPRGPSG